MVGGGHHRAFFQWFIFQKLLFHHLNGFLDGNLGEEALNVKAHQQLGIFQLQLPDLCYEVW